MKRFIIIILIVLILILLSGTVLYLKFGKKQLPSVDKQQLKIEKARENAFSKTVKTNGEGDALIVDKPTYQIVYLKKNDQFLISINKSPFEEIRKEAEEEFRKITQADQEILCKLNVEVTTPSFANPSLSGKIFPLSFCKTSSQ